MAGSYLLTLALALLCAGSAVTAQEPITWTKQSIVLESDFSSWARMVQLPDESWLAAYMLATSPHRIRVKRSSDRMRSWEHLTEITEEGRDLDNPSLCLLADGTVLLAIRSVITGQSYYIETYRSNDNGRSFQYQSLVDWDRRAGGVYEPYLYVLPNGDLACFYTSEVHRFDTPAYSQTLSQKVSQDGGASWGPEIFAIAQPGAARPGIANIVPLPGGVLALFYEMCGTENCIGHVSYSTDGISWPGIGPALPNTFQNVQAVGLQNGLVLATSNLKHVILSADYTNSWVDTRTSPFVYGVWPALYETAPGEVALVMTGAGDNGEAGQYIRFGTVNASAFQPHIFVDTCAEPTVTRPQRCR